MHDITLRETAHNIRSDFLRIAQAFGVRLFPVRFLFIALIPSIVALTLYRISHLFHIKGPRFLAWPLWLLNQYVTKVDIHPATLIGERCLIGHSVGVVLRGRIGKNATAYGGGGFSSAAPVATTNCDIGGGGGLPCIGDNVVIGWGACVLGAITVGDNVTIGPGALVVTDIPAGATVASRPPQMVRAVQRVDA